MVGYLVGFRQLGQTNLSAERTQELEDALWHIEEMPNVSELVQMLAHGYMN